MTNHTELFVILDRSGSMADLAGDHVGGLKTFIEDQKTAAGDAKFTLVQFDDKDPFELMYDGVPIEKVDHIELIPRGGTPLLDAVGKTLAHAESRLKDHEGPVIMMVITDGQENASREWTRDKIKGRIAEVEAKGYKLFYLGANVDAFAEAGSYGISGASTANYNANAVGTHTVYATMSRKTSGARGMSMAGAPVLDVMQALDFTEDEVKELADAGAEPSKSQAKRLKVQKEK